MLYDFILLGSSILFGGLILMKILPGRGVKQITTLELKDMIKKRGRDAYQLIDVRKPEKYVDFHVHGFRNIPLKDIRKGAKQLSKEMPTVVICQTGAKGNEACKRLKRRGVTQIYNVRGGLSTWEDPR